MENTKIKNDLHDISIPLKSGIKRNQIYGNEGQLEDLIGAQVRGGCIRPVRKEPIVEIHNPGDYENITIHKRSTFENYIAYCTETRAIYHFNPYGGVDQNLITLVDGEELNQIQPFLNYIIISTSKHLHRFLFLDGSYVRISINLPIKLKIEAYDEELVDTDSFSDHDYESLRANIYEKINEESKDGRLIGAISWRAAYKLIDGSYLMTTTPEILARTTGGMMVSYISDQPQSIAQFYVAKYKTLLTPADYATLEDEKDIISSIVIFFSKPIHRYDIEETTDEEVEILETVEVGDPHYFSDYEKIDEEWETIASPEAGWFKVCEIPFSDIIEKDISSYDVENGYMKLKNFYQNYATRESLAIDQQTHHAITAEKIFVYNSRLWMAQLTKNLAAPIATLKTNGYDDPLFPSWYLQYIYNTIVVFRINTGNKTQTVVEYPPLARAFFDGDIYRLELPMLSYPDQRASEVSIYIKHEGIYKEFLTEKLSISSSHNFAYYIETDDPIISGSLMFSRTKDMNTARIVDASEYVVDNIDLDNENQIQLSEINNPLIFPTAHNYKIGSGSVLDFGVSTIQVSEGQFGQYPVIIFTDQGIWAAQIGIGEVIVETTIPINADVLIGSPAASNYGVFYVTAEGIMVIQGGKSINVSKDLEGYINSVVTSDTGARFDLYSTPNQIVNIDGKVTGLVKFKEILNDLVLGFDNVNKRLIVSKQSINYSYVLDIDTNSWYRIEMNYSYFINSSPNLLGANGVNSIYNISDTLTSSVSIPIHFHTKQINFGTHRRKRLHESVLRCLIKIDAGNFASFLLFASNDAIHWTRVAGNDRLSGEINDIQIGRPPAAYKFFVFAFWGFLSQDYDNHFEEIEVQAEGMYPQRLRSY